MRLTGTVVPGIRHTLATRHVMSSRLTPDLQTVHTYQVSAIVVSKPQQLAIQAQS